MACEYTYTASFAVTRPFLSQINYCYYCFFITAWRKDDAQFLIVVTGTFYCIFFVAVIIHHSNIFITVRVDNIYRKLFASPLMHRIHHSKVFEETNSNFGALFSFWDTIFRSRKNVAGGEINFGLPESK